MESAPSVVTPLCPLCQTLDRTISEASLNAGETWNCVGCGQTWSARRLEAVAAYARYVASRWRTDLPTVGRPAVVRTSWR